MSEVKRPLWTCIVEVHGEKINKNKTTTKKKEEFSPRDKKYSNHVTTMF